MEMSELIAEARNLSGEGQGRQQFPTIKFMGRDSQYGKMGNYYLLRKDNDTGELKSEDLGTAIEITILKIRKMLDNKDNGDDRQYTYEFDSTTPGAMVGVKDGQAELQLMSYRDVKERYPNMKYNEVLYVAYKGELCKMKVSGGSLGNFFKYLQDFPINDTVMRYFTKLNSENVKHPKGDYHAITFTRGEVNPDFEKYVETIRDLALPQTPSIALPSGDLPDSPIPTDKEIDEIDVKTIPF